MTSNTHLVLVMECSSLSDVNNPIRHFVLPQKYYSLMNFQGIDVLLCEMRADNTRWFVAFGEVNKVESAPESPDNFTVEIVNCRSLSTQVADYELSSESPNSMNQFSETVCQIDHELFELICRRGGLELASLGVEKESSESNDSIKTPFDPSKIKVDREPMTVYQILRKIDFEEIIIDPEFQRNLVWDSVRRSRLIESALLRLPLPAFYFDGVNANEWTVVDGLQRLTTLHDFMKKGYFKLQGLEYLSSIEGKGFHELPRGMQRDLEETQLMLFIIRPETPPDVKFTIFYRINTGGMVLTAQEIRHALFQGQSTVLLKRLAESTEFLSATGESVSDLRMEARECVIRYLAFRIHPYNDYLKSDLNSFLSKVMRELNAMTSERIVELEQDFREAMKRSQQIFGRFAFRKFAVGSNRRGPINKAMLESWANVLQCYDGDKLRSKSESILHLLSRELMLNSDYTRSLSAATSNVSTVRLRFQTANEIVRKALND